MKKFIAAVVLILIPATAVFACQCKTIHSINSIEAKSYDVIFVGKVLAVSGDDERSRARFKVTELYKGEVYDNVEVEYDAVSDCGMTFVPGEVWTIYSKWVDYGVPRADMCGHSRSQPITGQQDFYEAERGAYTVELQWLKDSLGIQPFIDPKKHKDLSHKNQLPDPTQAIVYTLAGFLGLAGIFLLVKRMFKRDGK